MWRGHALAIPDCSPLREDALMTLELERFNAEGAALFATVPRHRDPSFLRLLVAYQVLLDFLDTVSERPSPDPIANGHQLHLALVEALEPQGPLSDYYRHHPWREDQGYLNALVQACRETYARLPCHRRVHAHARRAAARLAVQTLNHHPDPLRRDMTLKEWSENEFPGEDALNWWELTAASSSSLCLYALFSLAAEPTCTDEDVANVDAAYMPWVCAASTMLDSYVDLVEDIKNDAHSYISHYPDDATARRDVAGIIRRSALEARRLPQAAKHTTIIAGMIAMYLSEDTARTPETRLTTDSYIRAGGSLPRLLLPILRSWRILLRLPSGRSSVASK
jgi:tetraprenyl-beta-curcumene synthase